MNKRASFFFLILNGHRRREWGVRCPALALYPQPLGGFNSSTDDSSIAELLRTLPNEIAESQAAVLDKLDSHCYKTIL